MTDLHTLMRDSAESIPTGPPPYVAIRRQAHRRRAATWGGAIAAGVVVALAASGIVGSGGRGVEPSTSAEGDVPVFLDTSGFEVGVDQAPGSDTLRGTLRSTEGDRCLVVGDGPPIFWPQGWEGLTRAGGGFTLLDQDGRAVAEVGDTVVLHGLVQEPASWGGNQACVPGVTATFMVTDVDVE